MDKSKYQELEQNIYFWLRVCLVNAIKYFVCYSVFLCVYSTLDKKRHSTYLINKYILRIFIPHLLVINTESFKDMNLNMIHSFISQCFLLFVFDKEPSERHWFEYRKCVHGSLTQYISLYKLANVILFFICFKLVKKLMKFC